MELIVVLLIAGAAVAAVLVPLLRGGPQQDPALEDVPAARRPRLAAEREKEIERYRHALRGGTVCGRCGRANPDGSRYCAECGRRLPAGRTRRSSSGAVA